jgi:glutaredoxin-related protein
VSPARDSWRGGGGAQVVYEQHKHETVPIVYVNGTFIGGCDSTLEAIASGKLKQLLA